MNQSELIARIRDESPYFATGLDDEALWRVLQGRYKKLENIPYRPAITPHPNLTPDGDKDIDYETFSPSTVNSLTSSIIEGVEAFSLPEKMLGKGVGGDYFKSISNAMGVSPEFWKYAYTHSLSGMAYATAQGKQKYDIEEYAENADWKTDAGAFFAGIFQPIDLGVFAISGGIGGLARGGASSMLAKEGLGSLGKYIAKKRGLTHGFLGGIESMVNLGTFSAAGAALAESSDQAVKGQDIDMMKVFHKGAEGFLEGAAIGSIAGGITKGTLGAKYGTALINSGEKSFGNKVTKVMAHPLTGQTGLEAALFTSVPTVIGMEGAPAFGDNHFWGELAKNVVIIGGLRASSGLTSRGKAFGKDAEEIIGQAFEKASESVKSNNESIEKVQHRLETELGVDVKKIAGMGDALANAYLPKVELKEFNNLKISLKRFREIREELANGTIPMEHEKRTPAQNKKVEEFIQNGVFLDQVLRGTFEKWKNNESEFISVLTELHGKVPNQVEIVRYKAELERILDSMNESALQMNEAALNPNIKSVEGFEKPVPSVNFGTMTDKELIRYAAKEEGRKFDEIRKEFTEGGTLDREGLINYLKTPTIKEKEGFQRIETPDELAKKYEGQKSKELDDKAKKIAGLLNELEILYDPKLDSKLNESHYDIQEAAVNYFPTRAVKSGGRAGVKDKTVLVDAATDIKYIKVIKEFANELSTRGKSLRDANLNDVRNFIITSASGSENALAIFYRHIEPDVRDSHFKRAIKDISSIKSDIAEIPLQGLRIEHIGKDGHVNIVPSKSLNPKEVPISTKLKNLLKKILPKKDNIGNDTIFRDTDGIAIIGGQVKKLQQKYFGSKKTPADFRKALSQYVAKKYGQKSTEWATIDAIGLGHGGALGAKQQRAYIKDINLQDMYIKLRNEFTDLIFSNKKIPKDFSGIYKEGFTVAELRKGFKKLLADKGIDGNIKIPTELGKGKTAMSKDAVEALFRYMIEVSPRPNETVPQKRADVFIEKVTYIPTVDKSKKSLKDMTTVEQLEFSLSNSKEKVKNLRTDLKNAKDQGERMSIQGLLNEELSYQKGLAMQLHQAKKEASKKREAVRKPGEIIFKSQAERDSALKNFMARNKMTKESLKEAKLNEGQMGEFFDGAIKLIEKKWQPIDFFHENTHRLEYYAKESGNKKILNLFKQGEKLVKNSQEYKDWLKRNPNIKNPLNEFFADVTAKEAVKRGYTQGFINKIKQWANRVVSSFKVAFNKGDYKDIASVLSKKVFKGFEVKGELKTGKRKFRMADTEDVLFNVRNQFKNIFKDYKFNQAEKQDVINLIAEMAGIIEKGESFTFKTGINKEGIDAISLQTFSEMLSSIDAAKISKKKNLRDWFRTYNTTENIRLRANVNEKLQKEILKDVLFVKDGDVFQASRKQLVSYLDILKTMDYKKRTPDSWIDDKLMVDNLPPDIVKAFTKSSEIAKLTMPTWMIIQRMGGKNKSLATLSNKLFTHSSVEGRHRGELAYYEAIAKNIAGRKWGKWSDFIYLFDHARYKELSLAGKLSKSEKKFIENATSKEWRETGKLNKNSFTLNKEGKFAKAYQDYIEYYPKMIESIIENHMNKAEFEKWKKNNNIKWIKDNVYIGRSITEAFKKAYNPNHQQIKKIVDASAVKIATEMAHDKYKSDYKGHINEFMETAQNIAWAEISDMMNYGPGKLSSRFLKKRHIKLPEELVIDGKRVKVYETEYEKIMPRYSEGISTYMATLEIFPEYANLPGFKFPGQKANIEKLKAIDKNNGAFIESQVKAQLGIGKSEHRLKKSEKAIGMYAGLLAKLGLSFPTSGLKNFILGSTQTTLAFNVRDFMLGFAEATMSPSARKELKRTGATEMGMRHHEEIKTFRFIDKGIFTFGGMKVTENLNRYIALLAGRRDQARMIKVLQTSKEGSRKYEKAYKRMTGFYFLSPQEIALLKKHGLSRGEGANFKDVIESGSEKRKLNNIYDKMDTYAHVNTQGSSGNIFMPYWAQGSYTRPLTLYKRMAFAASTNTLRNVKNAYETGNMTKVAMFGLGTYFSGESLMWIYDKLLGTTPPKENEAFWNRLTTVLWKGEFMGILSEFLNPKGILQGDISMSVYPAIYTNAAAVVKALSGLWGKEMTYKQALDFVARRTVGLYGGIQKIRERTLNPYNKQVLRFRKLATDFEESKTGLGGKQDREYIQTVRSKWYKDLRDAWNLGTKEEFQKMYWVTYMGVANDIYRKGRLPDGKFINTMEDALKGAKSILKGQLTHFNPNRYSITKDSEQAKRKAISFKDWLGEEKTRELEKLEAQYWHKRKWWKDKGFMESINKFNLNDMYKEFNWSPY